MQCPNCNNVVPDTANVCGYCGHQLKQPAPPSTPIQPAPVQQTPAPYTPPVMPAATRPRKGIPGWVLGIVGILVLAIVGVAVFAILSSRRPASQVIEPYQPSDSNNYPNLGSLADNKGNVRISGDQPLWLTYGWCATTQAILDQNLQHITVSFTIDGRKTSQDHLYAFEKTADKTICRFYSGLVRSWDAGQHTVDYQMITDEAINDGTNDYPKGDLGSYHYIVNVNP